MIYSTTDALKALHAKFGANLSLDVILNKFIEIDPTKEINITPILITIDGETHEWVPQGPMDEQSGMLIISLAQKLGWTPGS